MCTDSAALVPWACVVVAFRFHSAFFSPLASPVPEPDASIRVVKRFSGDDGRDGRSTRW